jgi:hypothetical protein
MFVFLLDEIAEVNFICTSFSFKRLSSIILVFFINKLNISVEIHGTVYMYFRIENKNDFRTTKKNYLFCLNILEFYRFYIIFLPDSNMTNIYK